MVNKYIYSAALVLTLSACGGGGGSSDNTNTGSGTPTTTPTAAPAPTSTPTEVPVQQPTATPTPQPDQGATLTRLQDEVFGVICTQCHIGGAAPQGLRFDNAQLTFDHTVNIPSNEQPNLLLVEPGNPDDSYLVHKIEGRSSITGGRMPLGQPALPQSSIDMVREWITNGASQ